MEWRILVVESDSALATPLVQALRLDGYEVSWVDSGQGALEVLGRGGTHVVILDVDLPDMDGVLVCQDARAGGYRGALMIVTARGLEVDRVLGLDAGADDYLVKPFMLAELLARVRALLRRTAADAALEPGDDDLRIDHEARRVHVGRVEVRLTAREFDVLALLLANRDAVVSRGQLLAEVWLTPGAGSVRAVDVTIARLRRKLVDAEEHIVAVRGTGFMLTTPAQ